MTNPKYMEETRAQGVIYKGMFERGLSIVEIARWAGVNRSTVERWVYRKFGCPKRRRPTVWTEEMDNTLKEMWAQNKLAAEIGKAIGMSKGSVLGRRFRLKLENRPHTSGYRGGRKPGARGIRRAPIMIVVEPTESASEPVGFMDLAEHHCREVMGKGAEGLATYCGGQRVNAWSRGVKIYISPYCASHTRINYQT